MRHKLSSTFSSAVVIEVLAIALLAVCGAGTAAMIVGSIVADPPKVVKC